MSCLDKCTHKNCLACGEVIDWVKDYGHVLIDGSASCIFCYEDVMIEKLNQQTESRK